MYRVYNFTFCDKIFRLHCLGGFHNLSEHKETYPEGCWGYTLLALGTTPVLLWTAPQQCRWCRLLLPTSLKRENLSAYWQWQEWQRQSVVISKVLLLFYTSYLTYRNYVYTGRSRCTSGLRSWKSRANRTRNSYLKQYISSGWVRGLPASFYIVYDCATSGHMDL